MTAEDLAAIYLECVKLARALAAAAAAKKQFSAALDATKFLAELAEKSFQLMAVAEREKMLKDAVDLALKQQAAAAPPVKPIKDYS